MGEAGRLISEIMEISFCENIEVLLVTMDI